MSDRQLTDGSPVPEDGSHTALRADGQQVGYVVLTPEERAKGFVKPVRCSYLHVGPPALPPNLRDLTDEEHAQYDKYGYVRFEPYGHLDTLVGKFWTQKQIDRAGKRCGSVTTMGRSLAETYARNPRFYSGTFCCACQEHFPLNEFTWEPDGEPMDPILQEDWPKQKSRSDAEARFRRARERVARAVEELAAANKEDEQAQIALSLLETPR